MRGRRAALLALAASLWGGDAAAQVMRTLTAARPLAGSPPPTRADVSFGAGRVILRAGDGADLYRMRLRYDSERFAPRQAYDPRTGHLALGLESVGRGGIRVTSRAQLDQVARFEFAPAVPLDLTAHLGASEASLDLGGLTLTELTVRSGGVRGIVDFSGPTLGDCRRATFSVGGSELDVLRLANAGCREVVVDGNVGRAVLDFGGAWRSDVRVEAALAMGHLTLRVPEGTGLRITAERFLSALSLDGMERDGNTWSTPGFDAAPRKVTVALTTALAGLDVVREQRTESGERRTVNP